MYRIIRRFICFTITVILLIVFSGCRKNPDSDNYSALSEEIEYVYSEVPLSQEQSNNETETSSNNSFDGTGVSTSTPSHNNDNDVPSKPATSTITAPEHVYLYKNGKKYIFEDTLLNLQIAKKIESMLANIDGIGIPAANLLVLPDLIWDIKDSETAIELFYDDEILLNGNLIFGKNARSVLIPITGEYNDLIFDGDGNGIYFPGPVYSVSNSSFNEFIKTVKIEKLVETPSIRITLPEYAFLYKEGKKYRITNEEQVLNIAKEIEDAFYWLGLNKRQAKIKTLEKNLDASEILNSFKHIDTGIEFYYGEQEILLNGNRIFDENVNGFFIPVGTEEKCYIFTCETEGNFSEEYYLEYGINIDKFI